MRLNAASDQSARNSSAPGVDKSTLPTLSRLHCFEVVVEESGITRATARLHMTQPALSYQIKHLEQDLGAQLFHRGPGGISLTDAGRVLYTHARRVSAAVRDAQRAIQELPASGQVRIATVNSIGTYFLPQVLCGLQQRHAAARPVLCRTCPDDPIAALLANEVDVAILADPRLDRRLRYETLFEERVSLVSGRSHPFFEMPIVTRKQLRGAQLVALSEQTPTGALLRKHLERLDVHLDPVVTTDDIETLKRMVENGMGVGFLPDMVTAHDVVTPENPAGRLRRSLIEPPAMRRIVLVTWNEIPSSRAVAAFVAEVQRQVTTWAGAAPN